MICSWVRRSLEIKIMAQSLSVYSKLTWLRPNKCLLIFRGGPFRLPLHRVWLREQIQMLYAKRQTHGCPAKFWSAHNAAHKCIFLAILFLRCSCHAYILITDIACSYISRLNKLLTAHKNQASCPHNFSMGPLNSKWDVPKKKTVKWRNWIENIQPTNNC